MRKQLTITALTLLASVTVFAQTPSTTTRPPSEINPVLSGGPAAAKAQANVEERINHSNQHPKDPTAGAGKSTPPAEINPTASGGKSASRAQRKVNTRLMDTNGDGTVSREEWDAYHDNAWKNLNPSAAGVSSADLDRLNRTSKTVRH